MEMKRFLFLFIALITLVGCDKKEFDGYDHPFICITTETGASSITVLSKVNNLNTYIGLPGKSGKGKSLVIEKKN